MRKKIAIAFVLLVLSMASTVRANNDYEVWTHYFNCSMTFVGGNLRECDNDYTWWGQQYGAFKAVEHWDCYGATHTWTDWYEWTSSGWVLLSGEPQPSC